MEIGGESSAKTYFSGVGVVKDSSGDARTFFIEIANV